LLEERIERSELLHVGLAAVAEELWGLDVDEPGLEALKKRGYQRLFLGSAEDPPAGLPRRYFDLIVAGEVIEHVRNPGLFIESSGGLLRDGGRLVLTTPNALRYYNPIPAIAGRELVHPQHLTWYSPHTLEMTLKASSFHLESMYYYSSRPYVSLASAGGILAWAGRALVNLLLWFSHPAIHFVSPHLADGIVAVARPANLRSGDDR